MEGFVIEVKKPMLKIHTCDQGRRKLYNQNYGRSILQVYSFKETFREV